MLPRPRTRRTLIPYLMFAAALLLTVAAASYAARSAAVEERLRFENTAAVLRGEVATRLDAYVAMLLGGAGLFAASDVVELDEFRAYVARLDLPGRYPGVQGIGFSRWIPDENRHAIVYLEPLDARNTLALGFDMFSEPVRRAAMERARDTGDPSASGIVRLVQEGLDPQRAQAGFLIYVPVYDGGDVPASADERRRRLLGFVYSPFRGNDLLRGVLQETVLPGIGIEVYDGAPEAGGLLHRSGGTQRFEHTTALPLPVAGRSWTIVTRGDVGFAGSAGRGVTILLVGAGVLLSAVLFVVTRAQVRARAAAEATAEELRRSEEALRAANQAKDDFLASLSHELRTPLNAIVGWSFMLRHKQVPDGAQAQALDVIDRNAAALTRLIEDLLDVSRAIAGRLPLHIGEVDLAGLLTAAMATVEPAAREHELTMVSNVPPDIGPVRGDVGRLQQVVLNLLSNAVKFTPRGGTITLSADAGAESVSICVADTGAGIAPEYLEKVFERFWQADASTTREHPGMGLGLTICRHLVELHGGTIEVASRGPGHGTTITVRLPRRL